MTVKKPNMKRIIFVLICLIMWIVPLLPFLLTDSMHDVNLGAIDYSNTFSIKTCKISQSLICQGSMKDIEIYLSKEILDPQENTAINCVFLQDDVLDAHVVMMNDINSGKLTNIPIDSRKFKEGVITLLLSVDPESKNNVYIALAQDDKTGLEGADIDGVVQRAPIALGYKFCKLTAPTIIGFVLMILLIVIILYCSTIIEKKKDYQLMAVSFLVIVFIICIRQPTASYIGEPRSEAAYDFWQRVHNNGFFGSILALECNLYYLSFLQRIAAWVADMLSPSSKYVFVIMQMIQVLFIAATSCMVWSKKLVLNIDNYTRLFLCVFIGTAPSTLSAYYFHFLGYWGIIFIMILLIVDMDKLKKVEYICALLLTAIICLSKMAYVVFVPFVVIAFILYNKKLNKRRTIWLLDIIISCSIQVSYTFTHTSVFSSPEASLGTIRTPGLFKLINGLFYYAVQGINTFAFNSIHENAMVINIWILIGLLLFIGIVLYQVIVKNSGCHKAILCLGVIYFSIIGFCMLTSAGGFDMLASINWKTNIFLTHVHFIFIKYVLLALVVVTAYTYVSKTSARSIIIATIALITAISSPVDCIAAYGTSSTGFFPTEWRKVYSVVRNEEYYLPINVGYPFSGISLTYNTRGVIYGFDASGNWNKLGQGIICSTEIKYDSAVVEDIEKNEIVSASVKKANTYFNSNLVIQLYDRNGELIAEKEQANSDNREWIDFLFDKKVYGVYRVSFIDSKTKKVAYVCDELSFGVVAPEND